MRFSRPRPLATIAIGVTAAALLTSCDRPAPPPTVRQAAPAPGPTATTAAATGDEIVTTFYPSSYFAGRLTGGRLKVRCVTPPGADPMEFRPSMEAIAGMQSAGLIVLNGAGFEKWARTASLPPSRTVELSRPFAGELLKFKTVTHSHGPTGAHSHEGVDGHTWMDPVQAQSQARELARAVSAAWPKHATVVETNLAVLLADLGRLDADWRALAPALSRAHVLTNHQAYSYPARRYGFGVINLDVPPDEPPTPEQWLAVGRAVAEARLAEPGRSKTVMLFEEAPLAETAKRLLDEFGIVAVAFPPGESEPEGGGTYLDLMLANLRRLGAELGNEQPPVKPSS
ncbi:MAG: metal ABC transporter substrate-binding protein [Phycisphaerales bacterium]|nr:metal ABC transporter substrate-binding protein [Phycisphaerales bacterium]